MIRQCFLTVLFALAAASAMAAGGFDPRAHGDLHGVIALCASEPGSPRFDAAWIQWLRENPDADVDGVIRTVVSRAGTVRSLASPGMAPTRPNSRPDSEAISAHMRALARRENAETASP
ncbi:MAG TPA: hypothetical protein VIS76_08335 [Pseudomonadales bacterium]